LLNFTEIGVPGGLERCIRVLVHVNTEKSAHDIKHVYLDGARVLRPDLNP
jgi:chorismate mutase